MYLLYRAAVFFILPLFKALGRTLGPEKIKKLICDRDTEFVYAGPPGAVMIHCSSGEFEYAKPVIDQLKKTAGHLTIVVSYFSPSYEAHIKAYPGVDAAFPLPFDQLSKMQKLFRDIKPCALLIARTDTWPEMIEQAKQHRVPTLLFSATFSAQSGRLSLMGRYFFNRVLKRLDQIFVVSADDLQGLSGMNGKVKVAGDTRFDQVTSRLSQQKKILKHHVRPVKPCLVVGSSWEEDERQVLEVWKELSQSLQLILVPHEPTAHHLERLEGKLRESSLRFVRYSEAIDQSWDVLVCDEVGILAEVYTWGQFALVGGSFKKNVHSVAEPLAAGLLTFVGPFHANNREALLFQRFAIHVGNFNAVEVVGDGSALLEKLRAQSLNSGNLDKINAAIKELVVRNTGATKAVVDWVTPYLPPPSTGNV